MTFQDMLYTRVTPEETAPQMNELTRQITDAETPDMALDAFRARETLSDRVDTMITLAYIRFTINTEDAFYAAENDYYDEVSPVFTEQQQNFSRALVESKHRAQLEKELGSLLFQNAELALTTFSPEILPDLQEENRLTSEYVKLLASAQITFDGKTLNLSQITPYEQSPDRTVRRAACAAKAAFFEAHQNTLDCLFDELVQVRTKMARALGFPSFVELGYARMERNCYTAEDVSAFRTMVKAHITPAAARLKQAQAARIGVDALQIYDDPLQFPDGNACPQGTPEDIFAHGQSMYRELSPVTAEFFDFMMKSDLFDALSRPGKAPGGYCTYIPAHRSPFIFANFNGTAHDIDVLTHEAGHALAAYIARDSQIGELRSPTMDACEVHSMSMEFFTWPWMEGFFGEQTEKYRRGHLAGAVCFLPYGVIVDAFQHIVYENPAMTPGERRAAWLDLERTYRPWLSFDDAPDFYREGGRWQAQAHIFEMPFYYIDYCLAQTVALSFWREMQSDRSGAWEKYLKLLSLAGTRTFTALVTEAGMASPFDSSVLADAVGAAEQWLTQK